MVRRLLRTYAAFAVCDNAPALALVRGRNRHIFVDVVMLHRQNRKILVPARFAAQRRHTQHAPQKRRRPIHVFPCNSLQVVVPANGTVCPQRIAQRHQSRMKSRAATSTAPGINPDQPQNEVASRLPPRTSYAFLLTDRANHLVPCGFSLNSAQDRLAVTLSQAATQTEFARYNSQEC